MSIENPFDETRKAVTQAREILRACDDVAADMARLLVGRLDHCSPYILAKLKMELRNFNAHTGKWNNK